MRLPTVADRAAVGSLTMTELSGAASVPAFCPRGLYLQYVCRVSPAKTFYLQTFGCQMNVHDSEKVIGTLMSEGYEQVQTVEEADLILYNTCSSAIRPSRRSSIA